MLRHPQRHHHCHSMARGDSTPIDEILERTKTHSYNHPTFDADVFRQKRRVCRTPCQRQRLIMTQKELAELVVPREEHQNVANPNKLVDIGQCSGTCHRGHAHIFVSHWWLNRNRNCCMYVGNDESVPSFDVYTDFPQQKWRPHWTCNCQLLLMHDRFPMLSK